MHGTPSKKYIYETLHCWMYRKDHSKYYHYLELITQLIQVVFRQEKTVNPYGELLENIALEIDKLSYELLLKLIHSITLLNHQYRVYTLDGYITDKEDIFNALALLQLKINPESLLFAKTKLIFWELQKYYGSASFTVKEASRVLFMSKKTLDNHIRALLHVGYVKHCGTGIRNTYYYQIS